MYIGYHHLILFHYRLKISKIEKIELHHKLINQIIVANLNFQFSLDC